MKKVAIFLVFALIFSVSCSKKPKNPEPAAESEIMIIPEGTNFELESQPATQKESVKDALTPQIPVQVPMVPDKPNAEDIQKSLKNAGLYTGSIDGKIGPKTKKAIEQFQKQNNLSVDGVVGSKTWEKLKAYLTKAEESNISGNLQ